MDEGVLKKYRLAHDISDDVIDFARPMIKEGARIIDVAEKIEKKTREMGAMPSWPVNFSINEIAAHVTPDIEDQTFLRRGDLVKVDIGCQVDGYISDRAFTICVGEKGHPLIETSEMATRAALDALEPGVTVSEISAIIEDIVVGAGFRPIRNLAGHSMSQNSQHEPPTIPNSKTNDMTVIREGTPLAIEVFTTDGSGWVKESSPTTIYKFLRDAPVRMPEARKILEMAKNDFEMLPFATRWLNMPRVKMGMALRQLLEAEAIEAFPPLKEEAGGMVAVYEDTKIVL
ncbi:MAG: type II methionyl aminopeptidase [Candidatus Aenigmarchaeota archaeon]|nr:type II methionyl aminopeptidase [Candidatus Aenigmarchaeota archaeon]